MGTKYRDINIDDKLRLFFVTTGFSLFKGIGFGLSTIEITQNKTSTLQKVFKFIFLCFEYERVYWYKKDFDPIAKEYNSSEELLKEFYYAGVNSVVCGITNVESQHQTFEKLFNKKLKNDLL